MSPISGPFLGEIREGQSSNFPFRFHLMDLSVLVFVEFLGIKIRLQFLCSCFCKLAPGVSNTLSSSPTELSSFPTCPSASVCETFCILLTLTWGREFPPLPFRSLFPPFRLPLKSNPLPFLPSPLAAVASFKSRLVLPF